MAPSLRRLVRMWIVSLAAMIAMAPVPRLLAAESESARDEVAVARGGGGEPHELEVEEMSDGELARLAAQSPDKHPGGLVRQPARTASGLSWGFLGPRPILSEFWSGSTNASGRVSSVVVDPRDANVIYIAGAQGGVWKSVDGGTTWAPLTDQLSSLASGALAFDPSNPDVLYYGTGEQHYSTSSTYGDGLFRTTNAGATWDKIALKASVGSYIARVAVKPTNSQLLYVASDLGIVRSTDGGANWSVVLAGGDGNDLAIHPTTPATVYAAIRGVGIFRSTDDGGTWSLLAGGLPTSGFLRINFGLSPSNPLVLYAAFVSSQSATYGSLLGMYRTTNGGTSWTQLTSTPNYMGAQGWYDSFVAVDPTNSAVCYAGGVYPFSQTPYKGIIKTTNSGNKWSDITFGSHNHPHPDMHLLAFGPTGHLWLATDGGMWKSVNAGRDWINCNADLELTQFFTAGTHPTNPSFLLGGTQDNGGLKYTGGLGWSQINEGDGGPVAVEWDSPNIFYSTYVRVQFLYRFDNTARTSLPTPWYSAGDRTSRANAPFIIDPNVANTVWLGTHRVWKSTDSGTSWATDNHDLTAGVGFLSALDVAEGNSNLVYSGSSDGLVYVTTDGGANWTLRTTGLSGAGVRDLFVDPSDAQHAFLCVDATSGDRVFLTTDTGVSWTSATGNLPSGLRAMSLAVDFRTDPDMLYLGTDYGVYSSADGGVTWASDAAGLPNCAVHDLALDIVNDKLVAATHGRGKWSATVSAPAPMATIVAPRDARAPASLGNDFVLHAPVPSPSRAPIVLAFDLPRASAVVVDVFDVAGRMVNRLASGPRTAGRHAVTWNGKRIDGTAAPDGVYFVAMTGPDVRRLQRVVKVH